MQLSAYQKADATAWDELVRKSPMATFLHSRRYLSYHADRFTDCSVLIRDTRGQLVGAFPAAVDSESQDRVVSHPGITYGGLLHDGKLRGERMLEAFDLLKTYYRERGFESLRYKAVPAIYHLAPSADDRYALFRLGAVRYRCDLSCAIDLKHRGPVTDRRKRGLKKAFRHGVEVIDGPTFLEPFWQVLEENLARKFDVSPVHSSTEIRELHSLFPENIEFVLGRLSSDVVGGLVLFKTPQVVHTQYIAANQIGQDVCVLDAVFEHCIEKAERLGARYFNFGISTENEGQYLNTTLHQYKSEFGAGGVVHEFYEIGLIH